MKMRTVIALGVMLFSSIFPAHSRAQEFLSCREKSESPDTGELYRFFGNFLSQLTVNKVGVSAIRLRVTAAPTRSARVERQTVVVSEGLSQTLLNSSEAAFVVAHEVSHILLGHGNESKTREAEVSAELAADELALDLLKMAGHGLEGGRELLGRLDSQGKGSPLTPVRVAAMRRAAVSTRKNANT